MLLFETKEAKLYGLYNEPKFDNEKLFFYQDIFVRAEISENFCFIVVSNKNEDESIVKRANREITNNILKLVDISKLSIANNDDKYDSREFILHGAEIKILVLQNQIIAIGSVDEKIWISVNDFANRIIDIERFKVNYMVHSFYLL